MKRSSTWSRLLWPAGIVCTVLTAGTLMSSSHREAPMIAYDPEADNTDVYAFRNPTVANSVIIIANYIPMQLPQGAPNFYKFGEDVRYEIHVDNDVTTPGDDLTYRFTFQKVNEDPTTIFPMRLKKENQKNTYKLERSMDGGKTFETIVTNGFVPPYNAGERSIQSKYGLAVSDYELLRQKAVTYSSTGEKVFVGHADDPFFVDVAGAFDLGDLPRQNGRPQDGLACLNVNTIVLDVPIKTLQKDGKDYLQAKNILDPEFVIGVWASASRQSMRVLNTDGTRTHSGNWVQVSRLGMPLTNEAIIPFGQKDLWNSLTPYEDLANLDKFGEYFYNPELALYMDEAQLAKAVPAFKQLRIQKKSLGAFGFGNYQDGLFPLKGNAALNGTALGAFPDLLLPGPGKPRSVDIWPIFHTGVPNLRPYQLAVQKGGNPLAAGKPFISNFLPNGGDMLRLNMAVPVTKRDDPEFSSLGLVQAAVLGLTDPRFNKTKDLQYIPNMDGFPNGRRLEDDITRIELQAVSGVVLAAIGLWYDDYIPGSSPSPVTQDLVDVLSYTTGVEKNDTAFRPRFPFIQGPWSAKHNCYCSDDDMEQTATKIGSISEAPKPLGLSAPELILSAAPNPVADNNTVRYRVSEASHVRISVFDAAGQPVKVLVNRQHEPGTYSVQWNTKGMAQGVYFVAAHKNGVAAQNVRIVKE